MIIACLQHNKVLHKLIYATIVIIHSYHTETIVNIDRIERKEKIYKKPQLLLFFSYKTEIRYSPE